MTRVSSKPLSHKAQQKLFAEFVQIIASTNKKSARPFIEALLSPTEQTMLAKRIGVILLLHKKVPENQIVKHFHVSSQTVFRIRCEYKKGAYNSITKYLDANKRKWARFLKVLEFVLLDIVPPRVGMRRYKYLP